MKRRSGTILTIRGAIASVTLRSGHRVVGEVLRPLTGGQVVLRPFGWRPDQELVVTDEEVVAAFAFECATFRETKEIVDAQRRVFPLLPTSERPVRGAR